MSCVSTAIHDSIATITLGRTERRNALDEEMLRDIGEALVAVSSDPGVAVIVLRADGPAFTVGGDLQMFVEAGADSHDLLLRVGKYINPGVAALHASSAISIAAVHGAVAGGGIGFMAACDVVLAAEGTTFALGYSAIATTPDAGTSYFLTRDIGYRRALELYLTNRRFDAREACDMGLVNRVVAPDELEAAALGLAQQLAGGPREALAAGKRLFRQAAHVSLEHQLEDEITTFATNARAPQFAQRVAAFLATTN